MFANASLSFNPSAAADIEFIPNIRSEKPISIVPTVLFLSDFINIISTMPISARTGVKFVGVNRATIPVPLTEDRLNSQLVAVVPIFAPIITPIACDNFIIPEFTKPTIITVVAAEDCISAVTPAPSATPFSGLEVIFSSHCSSLPPASFSKASDKVCIPNINTARPPNSDNTS